MNKKEKIKYEIRMYFFLFMLYSFAGWIYETILFTMQEDRFINRGFNFGPYIPIYGFGAVLIMLAITKFIDEPTGDEKVKLRSVKIFFLILVLATGAELIGSYIIEYSLGVLLWDYSNDWMNFQGRIAPKSSFIFATGGTILFYTIQLWSKKLMDRVPVKGQQIFATLLLIVFITDFGASLITTIWYPDAVKKPGIMGHINN